MGTDHNLNNSFYQFLEKTGDFVAILNPDGQIVHINENGRFLLALFEEDVTQFQMADLIQAGQVDFAAVLDTAVSDGFWQGELVLASPEGLELPVAVNIVANQSENGAVDFLGFIANDVTERKWVESSLKESEIRFQGAFYNTSAGMAIISVDGRFLQVNQPFCNYTGYSEAELMQMAITELLHPDHLSRHIRDIARLRQGKLNNLQAEISYVTKNGQAHWAIVSAGSIYDVSGNLLSFLMQLQDITETKLAEESLRLREAQTRQIVDSALDAVISMDENGRIVGWNRQAEEVFGWPAQEIVGQLIADTIIPQQHREGHRKGLEHYNETGHGPVLGRRIEITGLHRDGHEFPIELSITAVQSGTQKIFNAFLRDITQRKQSEANLQRLSSAVQQAANPVVITDVQGLVEYVNPAFETLTGYTSEEIMGRSLNIIKSGYHDDQYYKKMWDTILAGEEFQTITINRKKNGDIYYEEKIITPIKNSEGTITHFLSNSQDITERHKLERQIQESLERRSHQVRLSTQITQEIAAAPNLPHLYNRVVTLVKETFGYYHVQILQHDPALDVMALVVGYGKIGEQMTAMHHSMPMGVGLIGTAARTGQTILRPVTANDANWQPNPLLPDTKGEIAVPIKMGDTILGVLDVQHNVAGALDDNDQILLEGLCGQIAVAIESTRLRQEMENRLRELDTLQRYMSREGWKDYQSNKAQIKGFLYSKVGVQPLLKDEETAVPSFSTGNGKAAPDQPASTDSINLPLTVRGQAIGSIGIEDDPDKPLSEQDSEFLNAIARQVSEALEAARLFEQTQDALSGQEQMAAELQTVAEVSTAASTILDVDNLLQTVVELVKLRFDLYHAHIYLVDEESNSLVLRAGAGDVGQIMVLEGRSIRFNADSLVARAARTRKGFIENDVRKIVDFLPHPLLPDTHAEMAIPLIVGSRLIGVMDLQSDKVGFFGDEAMQVQRTLASQIAVAVQNASMYAVQVEISSKLREVDRLKSEFLASMSHELRTPLNSIIGFADVLLEGLDGDLNERMEEDVRLIKESGTHLRNLIGDILDMSKIEAGRMELRYEEIDMRQLAHDILATANPLAQEKKLALILEMDEAISTITADRTRLRQVLWNIMGNAIKFTEKGSVTLAMSWQQDMIRVAIRDTGIGIKPEDMEVVFEQFRQIDSSLNRRVGGTGLGMPITRKLVELHGGEIGVDSIPGQGSTFWFTLPIEKPKTPRQKLGTGPLPALGTAVN